MSRITNVERKHKPETDRNNAICTERENGVTFQELADKHGISKSRVQAIITTYRPDLLGSVRNRRQKSA